MRDLESLKIEYVGYAVPTTKEEAELEILGLQLAIKCAEQRIALIRQGTKVAQMKSITKPKDPKPENE